MMIIYVNHLTWIPKDFFNFEEEHIHSYEFSLYEIKNNRTYIIVFLPKQPNTDSDKADSYIIKKFNFTSFNESGFSIIASTKVTDSFNNRIISSFSMDDYIKKMNIKGFIIFFNVELTMKKIMENISLTSMIMI